MVEKERIHPAVQFVADNLRKSYEVLQQSKTPEAKESAGKNVMGELLAASIITQYIERSDAAKS